MYRIPQHPIYWKSSSSTYAWLFTTATEDRRCIATQLTKAHVRSSPRECRSALETHPAWLQCYWAQGLGWGWPGRDWCLCDRHVCVVMIWEGHTWQERTANIFSVSQLITSTLKVHSLDNKQGEASFEFHLMCMVSTSFLPLFPPAPLTSANSLSNLWPPFPFNAVIT